MFDKESDKEFDGLTGVWHERTRARQHEGTAVETQCLRLGDWDTTARAHDSTTARAHDCTKEEGKTGRGENKKTGRGEG
ncbi:MAG: hypothetical protein ACOC59_00170 [Bacteroidota bacterium]